MNPPIESNLSCDSLASTDGCYPVHVDIASCAACGISGSSYTLVPHTCMYHRVSRDSADTQYIVFMTNKTPSGTRIRCEGTKPRTRKICQMFFLLSSFLGWASSILRETQLRNAPAAKPKK